MESRNVRALAFFVLFYITFGIVLSRQQERLIYLPSAEVPFGDCPYLTEAKPYTFGTTRFYHFEASPTAPLVVIYHGNAGSACHRGSYLTPLITTAGLSYLLVEYPGYGGDPTAPSHERVQRAAADVAAFVRTYTRVPTILLGESLGSGVATWHLSHHTPDAVVLITPLTTLSAIAREQFWFYPTDWLVRDVFDVRASLAEYKGPLLLVHGAQDTVVPLHHSEQIAAARSIETELVLVPGANHNDLMGNEVARAAIVTFLHAQVPE